MRISNFLGNFCQFYVLLYYFLIVPNGQNVFGIRYEFDCPNPILVHSNVQQHSPVHLKFAGHVSAACDLKHLPLNCMSLIMNIFFIIDELINVYCKILSIFVFLPFTILDRLFMSILCYIKSFHDILVV